jgi:hypothetical protein
MAAYVNSVHVLLDATAFRATSLVAHKRLAEATAGQRAAVAAGGGCDGNSPRSDALAAPLEACSWRNHQLSTRIRMFHNMSENK